MQKTMDNQVAGLIQHMRHKMFRFLSLAANKIRVFPMIDVTRALPFFLEEISRYDRMSYRLLFFPD